MGVTADNSEFKRRLGTDRCIEGKKKQCDQQEFIQHLGTEGNEDFLYYH
jgi:hypothetical protein